MTINPFRWLRGRRRRRRAAIESAVRAATNNTVIGGPFAGMRYPPDLPAGGSVLAPKLLGTYEMEIRKWIEALIAGKPSTVINIGAGEGYYAVGIAMRCSAATVIAFEADAESREAALRLASRNAVPDQVEVRGACSVADLAAVVTPGSVIVCDCEGCELDLLDHERIPALKDSIILVETHVTDGTDSAGLLRRHFTISHTIRELYYDPRLRRSAQNHAISPGTWRRAVDERRRNGLRWMLLTPRA